MARSLRSLSGSFAAAPTLPTMSLTSTCRIGAAPDPPIGEAPMTGAERQARYRAARMSNPPIIRIRRPVDRRSRIQRWNDTIATLTELQAEYGA